MEMMDDIKANVKDWSNEKEITDYLYKIGRKEAFDGTGLIYGMGHAVYTISDPRAILLRNKARELAAAKGFMDEFNLYASIEKIAPDVLYEIHGHKKRICTNVDFYSGFVYSMLNIPRELYTPLFAIARIAGWSAHRVEEIVAGKRIYRPAYKNIMGERNYIPMDDR
jgi:citrate synthase